MPRTPRWQRRWRGTVRPRSRRPRCCRSSQPLLCHLLDLVGLWLLSSVWVLGAGEDAKLLNGSVGRLVLRHHAADSLADDALWVQFQGTAQGHGLQATWVARVAVAQLAVTLVGGDMHLIGVDDDDVVAAVNVRREV